MNNQFTSRVFNAINYSKEEARRLCNNYIGTEHLVLGILREKDEELMRLLEDLNVNLSEVKSILENHLKNTLDSTFVGSDELVLTQEASLILKAAIREAEIRHCSSTDTEHILLAVLRTENYASRLFKQWEVDYQTLAAKLKQEEDMSSDYNDNYDEWSEVDEPTQSQRQGYGRQEERSDTPLLDKYGYNATGAAADGKLDPVIGREKEIERIAQILSRRKKNNPILIGEPGVGKTAIVEGLALRIKEHKVSRVLYDKRLVILDMASVVAGTKYRGQFEERLQGIIEELRKHPEIILFIDEIHNIIGAGSATGSMDAANMLKPALARGDMQCIGATTLDEYRKNIEKDGALDRRFQKVLVEPTSAEETLTILKNVKDRYEEHHNVLYTEEALEACVSLTDRYISDRFFPDKALDALDEAGSRAHLSNIVVPAEIEEMENHVKALSDLKQQAVKAQNFELAASYRDQGRQVEEKLEQMRREWESSLKEQRETVDEESVATVVSMMSGVPVQRMAQAEGARLLHMKDELATKVIAQDKAIETLAKAIRRSRVGLKDPNRPIGTFLFLGPTGVGKTYLAKQLAEFMFGSAESMIRIDTSEYMEKFSVSRLVGAPPGYVGYEEGGQLTEKVRRKPYSIVLLDEIEKAHPDTFNLLLQIMDEGRLTDSNGKTVDFKNTVIIMTSNVGTRQLKEFGRGVGFSTQSRLTDKEFSRSVIQKALNKQFAPEFLNRIDEIITFDQLSKQDIVKIVDVEMISVRKRIQEMGYGLELSESSKQFLADKGYDVQFGARPLKRALQSYLEDEVAELLLTGSLKAGDTILVEHADASDKLTLTPLPVTQEVP